MAEAVSSPGVVDKELIAEAKEMGLRYTSDHVPGITRTRAGESFHYNLPTGKRVKDPAVLSRIKSLVIPPAWSDVWISTLANGHIQATGRDARKRKQYRYHSKWRAQRDESKFQHILAFARVLPKIRRRVATDLRKKEMGRAKIIATVIRLLETTLIRIGNDEYARENHSYGLTTMRNRHVEVKKADISFSFRGKSGKHHDISLHDARLAKIIHECQELPGQQLFSYVEGEETKHVESSDVNEYLREASGQDFTAKDFRTWIGTVLAATAFRELQEVTSARQAQSNIKMVIESVAKLLGNTPAVCRKCYVHPEVIDAYVQGDTLDAVSQNIAQNLNGRGMAHLRPAEAAVLVLLQRRMKAAARPLMPSSPIPCVCINRGRRVIPSRAAADGARNSPPRDR